MSNNNNFSDDYDFILNENEKNEEFEYDIPNNEMDILNILLVHFNRLNGKIENLFDKIDYEKLNSTNRQLEFIYDNMEKLKESNENDKLLISENDVNNLDKIYILYINDKIIYGCKLLIPLISYLTTIDWTNCIWDIIFKD